LGGRQVIKKPDGKLRIKNETVEGFDPTYDGHINRNIRLSLAFLEITKPYIDIISYKDKGNDKIEIKWRVNGCYTLNEVRAVINDHVYNLQ
jgi:hypothetical protein